jgi:hypothetical protein
MPIFIKSSPGKISRKLNKVPKKIAEAFDPAGIDATVSGVGVGGQPAFVPQAGLRRGARERAEEEAHGIFDLRFAIFEQRAKQGSLTI